MEERWRYPILPCTFQILAVLAMDQSPMAVDSGGDGLKGRLPCLMAKRISAWRPEE